MEQNPYTSPVNQNSASESATPDSPVGPIIGTVIVIVLLVLGGSQGSTRINEFILVLGGWYFWSVLKERSSDQPPFIPGDQAPVEEESWLPPSSNSDDASAIQAELEAMNMSDFELYMESDLEASSPQL